MKISTLPIYVFLFSLFPLLLLFADNVKEIPFEDIIAPALISLGITSIVWAILRKFLGSKKSGLIITVFLVGWIVISQVRVSIVNMEYSVLNIFTSNKLLIPLFFIVVIPIVVYIIRKNISNDSISIVNVISIVIFSFLIFQIANYDSVNMEEYTAIKEKIQMPIFVTEIYEKPDVYFILLDAYSGDITLQNDFNFDNSKFKNKLRDREFVVQEPSYSNYPNTEAALPSIMNMVYLDSINEIVGRELDDKKILIKLSEGNSVMDIFQKNGYHITKFGSGVISSPSIEKDYDIPCDRGLFYMNEDLQRSIVETYFSMAFLRHTFYDDLRYDDLQCIISSLLEFEKNDDKPHYIHSHIFLPHPPFLYDRDGNRVYATYSTDRFDENLRDAYLEQLIFTNKITIEMIDSIQQKDDSAVIIVMSDHGGRLGVNWENPTEMDYYRAFNNLSAFYFPEHQDEIPEKVATVNTFRIFFNTYFKTDYEVLEDKQMWYTPEEPYRQFDVTEKLSK